jgi:polyphosphate kinase
MLHADGSWEPSPPPGSDVSPVRDHQAEMMLRHALTAVAAAE